MGKIPKNGFCYISVNKILNMTSQYNTSLGSLRNYFFPAFSVFCSCTDSIALQSVPNSDSYQVNSTNSNVMSSGFYFQLFIY